MRFLPFMTVLKRVPLKGVLKRAPLKGVLKRAPLKGVLKGVPFIGDKEVLMMLTVKTSQKTELIDITAKVQEAVSASCAGKGMKNGLCMVYIPHTTAAVTINESADPDVKADILMILNKIVPWEAGYRHMEGNSPAHVKATLVGASALVAFENKKLLLGTWQGIFFCEFDGPRTRKVHVRIMPE